MSHVTADDVESVILEECAAAISRISFKPTHWRHTLVICMACTVLDSAHTAVLLTRHGKGHDAKVLARKALEGLVDLKLLTTNSSYVDVMRLADGQYWLKQLNQGRDGNPYVGSLGDLPDIDQKVKQHQNEVDELKLRGVRTMTVRSRFEEAGLKNEYLTVYSNLSGHSHSRLSTLLQRHFVEDGEGMKIVAFGKTDIEEMQAILLSLRDWVRIATAITKEFMAKEMAS